MLWCHLPQGKILERNIWAKICVEETNSEHREKHKFPPSAVIIKPRESQSDTHVDSRGSPTLYKRVRAQCCELSAQLLAPPPSSTGPMRKIFCPEQAERARLPLFGPFPVLPQGFTRFQTLARSLVDGEPVHPKTTPLPPFSDAPQRGLVDPVAVIFSKFPLVKSCLRPRDLYRS
jgi:hypothetical protein